MDVRSIPLDALRVSNLNVRKTLQCDEDEANLNDLAVDISENGLLNPLTVRGIPGSVAFEVIAGQRRFMALKLLKQATAPCNVIAATDEKAEELSLIENVQRNQMTTADKVRAYSRLHAVYDNDADKVASAVHVSKATIMKYVKVKNLPEAVLRRLDQTGDDKLSIDVAVELTKMDPTRIDVRELCDKMLTLTSTQKTDAIRTMVQSNYALPIQSAVENVVVAHNALKMSTTPDYPFVVDDEGGFVRIPNVLFPQILAMIKALR